MKRFLLVILAFALLWGGGQNAYTSLENRAPTETTCAQLLTQPPDAHWLSLSQCEYDLENIAHKSIGKAVLELYIPLRPRGDSAATAARVVLLTEDKQLLDIVGGLENADPEQAATYAERFDKLEAPEQITGLVKFGIELKDSEAKELRKLNPSLPEDFILLEAGAQPMPLWWSLLLVGFGLLLSAWLALKIFVTKS